MVVAINGQSMLEYDRRRALLPAQEQALARMDEKMAAGIEFDGQSIAAPELLPRAQFVAMRLIEAIDAGDEQRCAALTSWLATRLSDLTQVLAVQADGQISIEFVFGTPFVASQPIRFTRDVPGKH
jgi:hypothetical protein